MSNESKRRYCSGCYSDFYNHRENIDGKSECWSLQGATVVKKVFVHLNDVPPWESRPETTLNCHRRQQYISVSPDHPQLAKRKRR